MQCFFKSRKEKENFTDDETNKTETNATAPVLHVPASTN